MNGIRWHFIPLSASLILLSGCTEAALPQLVDTPTCTERVTFDSNNIPRIGGVEYTWIASEEALRLIGDEDSTYPADGHYLLADDIELTEPFTPLPTFSGTLSGDCHTIKNLHIAVNEDLTGLFQEIENGAEIRHLTLVLANASPKEDATTETKPSVKGANYVGALAGKNRGTLRDVTVKKAHLARIEGQSQVGGLVGENGGIIEDSRVDGVVVYATGSNIGGLAGRNIGSISATTATITIAGPTEAGMNSLSVGGFVGENSKNGKIVGSESIGKVDAPESNDVGGFVGFHSATNLESLSNSSSRTSTRGKQNVGGFVGRNTGRIIESKAFGTTTSNGSSAGGFVGLNEELGNIEACTAKGDVTGGNNDTGGFVGTNDSASETAIQNSEAYGNVVGANTYVGGFVGLNNQGAIAGSSAFGKVSGEGSNARVIGGFVGKNEGKIQTSSALEALVGGIDHSEVGGFVGVNDGAIERSHSAKPASGSRSVGGFAGKNNFRGEISQSSATGRVTGTGGDSVLIGGFVGENYSSVGSIKTSFASDNEVSGHSEVGGFVGKNAGKIEDSYATKTLRSTGSISIGGFAGSHDSDDPSKVGISRCYATGMVPGTAGSFVGTLHEAVVTTITNSYVQRSSTNPIGNIAPGNRVPSQRGPSQENLQSHLEANIQPHSLSELSGSTKFSEWNFDDIWDWLGTGQWPELSWQSHPTPQI